MAFKFMLYQLAAFENTGYPAKAHSRRCSKKQHDPTCPCVDLSGSWLPPRIECSLDHGVLVGTSYCSFLLELLHCTTQEQASGPDRPWMHHYVIYLVGQNMNYMAAMSCAVLTYTLAAQV